MSRSSSPPRDTPSPHQRSNDSTMAYTSASEEQMRIFAARNSEANHIAALAAARAEHTRIRENALRVFELEQLRAETELIRQQRIQEEERGRIDIEQLRESNERLRQERIRLEERARLESERAAEELRMQQTASAAPTPPQPAVPPQSAANTQSTPAPPQAAPAAVQPQAQPPPKIVLKIGGQSASQPSASATPASSSAPQFQQSQLPTPQPNHVQPSAAPPAPNQPNQVQKTSPAPATQSQAKPPQFKLNYLPFDHLHPAAERYVEIHKSLKQLRENIKDLGKIHVEFKKKAGDMRRAIIRSMGQLVEGAGMNKIPYQTILTQLDESLTSVPGPTCDPNFFMVIVRPEPVEGAANNERMPQLTIYLLNILAKAAISQFCSEAGANPKAADPIGVILISVFSQPKYMWRGKTLIDILMAKLRVVCPVLFGVRGSDKTEEGRARLGWRKDENGKWISEQEHNDRMTGLGAGFASLCFRNFAKSSLVNPCPPHVYWQALASITLTPKGETSSTQFVVLKAMIDNYVKMFLVLYGRIGWMALRAALNDFPLRADKDNVAASSCKVLAEKISRDTGMQFIDGKK